MFTHITKIKVEAGLPGTDFVAHCLVQERVLQLEPAEAPPPQEVEQE